jgi:ubiquitin carboxyl-terminal hydrolase 9/13
MNYDNSASYGMPETLFTSLKDIFEALIANRSRTGVVSPAKFLEVLRKEHEMFRTSMHQDAHEFLNLLLNEVVANVESNSKKLLAEKASMDGEGAHSDLEKVLISDTPNTTGSRSPSNTGWVHELFEGTLTSETKCLTCENVSQRDEAFLDLSVDLDQHSSVTSCLRKFSEEEMLCERNKFHCDRCGGLQEAEKRMKIKRLPKILALHLKRFKYTEDLQRLQKLFHRVVYPYHLRLFNTTDDAEDPDRLYELYAVVVHIGGGPYHGHYVSIIKTQDRGWLLFDDEMVEPVDKNYVRNFFGERPGLACAYVLFYQETTLEAVKKEQEAEGLAAAAQSNITPVPKEPQGLGLTLKTNGHHANGHHFVSSLSPTHSIDTASALDRIATETPVMTGTTVGTPLSVAQTAPPSTVSSPLLAVLSQKKSEAQIRKERQREEKERKSAEKELEKVNRGLLKSAELRRKETERKNATDLKAAIEASKLSTKQDTVKHASIDKKSLLETSVGVTIAKPTGRTSTTTPPPSAGADVGLTALPELPPVPQANGTWATTTGSSTGTLASSTLNRFRQSSKSLSKKPKFWGSKADREKGDGRDESAIEDGDGRPPTAGAATAERKTRFSGLRRKTSSMLT